LIRKEQLKKTFTKTLKSYLDVNEEYLIPSLVDDLLKNKEVFKMDKVLAAFYNKEKAEEWTNELNKLLINANKKYKVDCYYTAVCCPAGGYFEIYLEEK